MFPIGSLSNNQCPIIRHCVKACPFLLALPQKLVNLKYSIVFNLRPTKK